MNKLVVFFSYTGHTKMIAEMIKEKVNCDILELSPVKPYSDDYQTVVDEEQNNNGSDKIIEINRIDKNLSNYDEIIIGTPVWWYSIAPTVRTFLKENDLSGKVIKPYATNAGWLGHTFKEIEELCPNSKIDLGMNIVFDSNYYNNKLITKISDVDNWINTL